MAMAGRPKFTDRDLERLRAAFPDDHPEHYPEEQRWEAVLAGLLLHLTLRASTVRQAVCGAEGEWPEPFQHVGKPWPPERQRQEAEKLMEFVRKVWEVTEDISEYYQPFTGHASPRAIARLEAEP